MGSAYGDVDGAGRYRMPRMRISASTGRLPEEGGDWHWTRLCQPRSREDITLVVTEWLTHCCHTVVENSGHRKVLSSVSAARGSSLAQFKQGVDKDKSQDRIEK